MLARQRCLFRVRVPTGLAVYYSTRSFVFYARDAALVRPLPRAKHRFCPPIGLETFSTSSTPEVQSDEETAALLHEVLYSSNGDEDALGPEEDLHENPEAKLLRSYVSLRNRDRESLSRLSYGAYRRLVEEAQAVKSNKWSQRFMSDLAADILEIFDGSLEEQMSLARMMPSASPSLSATTGVSLLAALDSATSEENTPLNVVVWVTKSVIDTIANNAVGDGLLTTFIPILSKYVRLARTPGGPESMTYVPPDIIAAAYALVRELLTVDDRSSALSVLEALIESGNIPPEALNTANESSEDFNVIFRSTLARSCLHWNWRRDAVAFLLDVVETMKSLDASTEDLTMDIIHTLLEAPDKDDLWDCLTLIRTLQNHSEDFEVSKGVIQSIYNFAATLKQGKLAEELYDHSQSSPSRQEYYPLPQGPALLFLMKYLVGYSRNKDLGRTLATQIAQSSRSLALNIRGDFIAVTAANGFGTQARALWERYSVGRDGDVVVGNTTTMVRMVSLFGSLVEREHMIMQTSSTDPSDTEDYDSPLLPVQDKVTDEVNNRSPEERMADYRTFAELVITEFERSLEPLSEASHQALNGLARAHFIMGNVSAGFKAFRYFLDRREVPDVRDVNVALSAMAEYDPHSAAQAIDRMVERGLRPDSVTFGTVIYGAILHHDLDLVHYIIEKARESNLTHMSLKAVNALIRAGLSTEDVSRTEVRTNLRRTWNVISALMNANFVCTPNTGKFCIVSALRVDDPLMAFKFWQLLVKDKAEWDDSEQVRHRIQMARMLAAHQREGWISRARADAMLSQLGREGAQAKLRLGSEKRDLQS